MEAEETEEGGAPSTSMSLDQKDGFLLSEALTWAAPETSSREDKEATAIKITQAGGKRMIVYLNKSASIQSLAAYAARLLNENIDSSSPEDESTVPRFEISMEFPKQRLSGTYRSNNAATLLDAGVVNSSLRLRWVD
jgi:hypothetical protein